MSPGARAPVEAGGRATALRDAVFLLVIVTLSAVPYVSGLGFYSDDWPFLVGMAASPEPTLRSVFENLYRDELRMRPVQILVLAVLFRLFALEPLGYHLVNTALLGLGAVLCYVLARELGLRRHIAVAVALIFSVLPHYSTDRFWIAAMQSTVSLVLYCLSLYGDLRATRCVGKRSWGWRIGALTAMAASVLAYEVFLPLFVVNLVVTATRARHAARSEGRPVPPAVRPVALALTTAAVLLPVVLWKLQFATRIGSLTLEQKLASFRWLITGAIKVSYGDYGIALPFLIVQILRDYSTALVSATAMAVALSVFVYVWRIPVERDRATLAVALVGAGFATFFLGYALFSLTRNAQYSTTGISNRVAIAATLGIALGWVGGIVALTAPISKEWLRRAVFAGLVAAGAGVGVLILGTIGTFWVEAYRQEQRVLHEIRAAFPVLPPGTTLILDGVCPYVGPAVVFDASWDLASALRLMYHDYTLRANVVTPSLQVEERGLKVSLYEGELVEEYPYRGMVLYHAGLRQHFVLSHADAARQYFAAYNPTRDSNCPRGREGHGVPIFERFNSRFLRRQLDRFF
jgi:hypothetical protein